VVQEFIGHESKAVSQNCTHIEMEAMRRATDLMPDVFAEGPPMPPADAPSESGVAEGDKPDRVDLSEPSGGKTEYEETQSEKVSRMVRNVRNIRKRSGRRHVARCRNDGVPGSSVPGNGRIPTRGLS
jgi:hypothetical protein